MEELARAAGLSVDTIRFYQKRRLLPPPRREGRIAWYGHGHRDRLAEIKRRQAQGLSLAVIRRLLDGELDPSDVPLAAAAAESEGGDPDHAALTVGELAARCAIPASLIDALVREGLLVTRRDDDGQPRFGSDDVRIVDCALELVGAGLPIPELITLARDHDAAARSTAEAAVAMFDDHVRAPLRAAGLPVEERATRQVEAFRALLPAVTALVAHHFRRVLLETAQAHLEAVGEGAELAAAEAQSDLWVDPRVDRVGPRDRIAP